MNSTFSNVARSNLLRISFLALGTMASCKCAGPVTVPASKTNVPTMSASAPAAPATLPAAPIVGTGAPIPVGGIDMIGNAQFNLTNGKIYGFNGAEIAMKDNRFRVKYQSDNYSGAVHTWGENPDWNGNPIPLEPYSKLTIVVEGSAPDTKVELNDTIVIDYGALKTGVNVVDLAARKKDDFAPLTELKKINFVNKPGNGQYIVRLTIE